MIMSKFSAEQSVLLCSYNNFGLPFLGGKGGGRRVLGGRAGEYDWVVGSTAVIFSDEAATVGIDGSSSTYFSMT